MWLDDFTGKRFVDDRARPISTEKSQYLDDYHRYLLNEYHIDYRVVTVQASGDITYFANQIFRQREVSAATEAG